ncbi:MAG: alpha/beta fold hydrolase [Planctomycetes bacterium]|nr:alpha/beta fold hydrolase [Planctomycetota bacterium]
MSFETRTTHRSPRRSVGLAMVLLPLLAGCDSLFYRPFHDVLGVPDDFGLEAEDVFFRAPGGPRLHGWWIRSSGESRGTVVFCHGNTGNVTSHASNIRWLPAHGFEVLLFDYRGYGKSEGKPARAGTVADAVAAIDLALARDPTRTVVFGHSLGGAIGLVACARRPGVRALVVESTFPSYLAAAQGRVPALAWLAPLLVSKGLDPAGALADIPPRPLLVIHGTDDGIVPVRLGWDLYCRAAEPKQMLLVDGAGHRTPWLMLGDDFARPVARFLLEAISGR